ncbi:MAG: sulfatase-like hydrolase/transferase [Deltaproteobacteria bacterium]|nr:sulfatase-like hydrolase/transferase [Deltaproteobacteria bacterium]
MKPGWLRRWAEAWLLASLVLAAEAIVVAVLSRAQFASGYDVSLAMKALLPLGMLLAMPVVAFGAAVAAAVEQGTTRRGAGALAVLLACGSGAVAFSVSTGRHLAGSRRPAFVLLVLATGAAIGWFGARPLGAGLTRLARASRVAVCASVLGAVAFVDVVNGTILPRLYPGFHLGLGVLALTLAALGGLALRADSDAPVPPTRTFGAIVGVALAFTLGSSLVAPRRLRLHDNLRLIYLERAPMLAHAVRLAAYLAPPPPLEDDAEDAPQRSDERLLDLGPRDVLLVTIDALRADHVGAYGYSRRTTPRLDALASDGALFEAAYTATPHTSYAVTSLMTGKYMRPLLMQGLAGDSETLPEALRRYDYRTAAFYPPAVFFVDRERFAAFETRGLGFEYRKEQFAAAPERAEQLRTYLATQPRDARQFVWVHLFEPHEPYVAHPDHDFGERAIDRYDSEVAAADAGLGAIVDVMRAARPDALVLVSADHGEEFGEHGGRYHGTSVHEEQVRVPLVVHGPGLIEPRRITTPVGLVDVMPTVLRAAGIPLSPRLRGRDLGPEIAGRDVDGLAFSETEEHTLLARKRLRLICARKIGACRLHDLDDDPGEHQDASGAHLTEALALRSELRRFTSSLGRFEADADATWPYALRRGIAGDVEAAIDVASLLTDADVRIRRKAAATLFELAAPEARAAPPVHDAGDRATPRLGEDVSEPLRRAVASDEDKAVRGFAALALTRLGEGAPLVFDMVRGPDQELRRLAALALAESGDARGKEVLLAWWEAAFPGGGPVPDALPFERAKQVVAALAKLRDEAVVVPLTRGLADVRLRRFVAPALARIGGDVARPALAQALSVEPYHDARLALARAIVDLGGRAELAGPLAHLLGVPDPLPEGLTLARRAEILAWVGGPSSKELGRLVRFATSGVAIGVTIPEGGNGQGLRVLVRARSRDGLPGEVRVGAPSGPRAIEDRTRDVPRNAPRLEPSRAVTLRIESNDFLEVHATLPETVKAAPKDALDLVVYATQNIEVDALAAVPLADDVPVSKRGR